MSRGTRTRVATGIYRDAFGFAIVVTVHGVNHERRWPLGTPLEMLKRERVKLKAEILGAAPMSAHKRTPRGELVPPAPASGPTLGAGLAAFLATLPVGSHRTNSEQLGAWWITAFGAATPLADITGAQLLTVMATWKADHKRTGRGHSASTLNKRRDTLRGIYRVVFGAGGLNPTAELGTREREPEFGARAIPRTAIDYIFAAMPDRARRRPGSA